MLVVAAARAARMTIIPLWADHIGLSAAATAVVFGVAGGVDMLLFYSAGSVMDRFGRVWIAVPSVAAPLAISAVTLVAPLAAASIAMGAMSLAGAGWLVRWVPRRPPSA